MHTGPRTASTAVRCSGSSAARTASAAPTGGPTWEPGEVTRACLQADAGHRPRDWKGPHPVPVDRDNAQSLAWALSLSTGTGCVPFQSRGRCPASACKHARVTSPGSHVGPPVGAAEAVLAALDPEQRTAVLAVRGPVCILAGAGTGKTRTITHRVAYGVLTGMLPASQLLAVTFTARAAGELRGRLRALGVGGVQARTFHAAALRQLGYFWPRTVGGELPRIVENKYQLVASAAARAGLRPTREQVRDLLSEIEWAKSSLHGAEDYPVAALGAHRDPPFEPVVVATVFASYDQLKTAQGVLDFDDLLLLMAAVIGDYPEVTTEVRDRYRHFVVDEYQDVTPLQQQLLDAWLGERDDLCVVGDAQQTIYSFAGDWAFTR